MARKSLSLFLCFFLLVFSALFASGQRGGVAAYTASDRHDIDSVDLVHLIPTFTIPINPKAQGALPGGIILFSSQYCTGDTNYTHCPLTGNPLAGTLPGIGMSFGLEPFIWIPNEMSNMKAVFTSTINGSCTVDTVTALSGADGLSVYPIPSTTLQYPSSCGSTTATVTSNNGTGITASLSEDSSGNVSVTSVSNSAGWTESSSGNLTDPFGNTTTVSGTTTTTFTDTLGAQTNLNLVNANGVSQTLTYTDTTGTTQTINVNQGTSIPFSPTVNCGWGTRNYNKPANPITSIGFPDGTSFGFTWDVGNAQGTVSGYIKSITLRTGGTITYTYGTASCTNGFGFATLTRQTADGTDQYSTSVSNGIRTTTKLDPGMNKTVWTFFSGGSPKFLNFLQTVTHYQNTGTVANPSYLLLSSSTLCYNNASCSTAPTYPITQLDTYNYVGNGSLQMNHDVKTYDGYGNVLTDANTDSITTQLLTTTNQYGTYNGTSCVGLTNTAIHDHLCSTKITAGVSSPPTVSSSLFSYNANGALTQKQVWTGSTWLSTSYTPNSNGTQQSVQSKTGQTTTITYGNCNGLLPTATSTTVNGVTLTTGTTWDCNGAVALNSTDANSNESFFTFDSMFRPSSQQDPLGFTVNDTYTSTSAKSSWSMSNPSASSATYIYTDGLGRTVNKQTTNGSNYNTRSSAYAFNGPDWQTQTSEPCSKTSTGAGQLCSSFAHTTLTDPLTRTEQNSTISNDTINYGYSGNDTQVTLTPAPGTEHVKSTITEVDGFGRMSNVCNVLAGMGSTCHQLSGGNHNGVFVTYSYSFAAGSSTVTITRGSQTHTSVYDALGRITSETYPESGTKTYTYDSVAAAYCDPNDAAYSSPGNLVATSDGAGNHVCYRYDGLNRLTDTDTNHDINNGGNTACRHFRYDSTANAITLPSGFVGTNLLGRILEANTNTCGSSPSARTDETFNYDADGRLVQKYTDTVNASGYEKLSATYYPNGATDTLTANNGNSYGGLTISLDSNGNPTSSNWAGPNGGSSIVSSITLDSGGRPTSVGVYDVNGYTDADTYGYDSYTGNMNSLKFTSNQSSGSTSASFTGTPGWNANGTLGSLAISDGFNSAGTQTCNFTYDDLARLTDDNCGTVFHNSFSYDQYDNLTQTGSLSWNPGYSSTNNEETGSTYDSAGNVLFDGINTYTWDAYGKMLTVRSGNSAAVCGTSGSCVLTDAFGKIIESNVAGSITQFNQGPGFMQETGAGCCLFRIPQPGGGTLIAYGTNSQSMLYMHPDWLGTVRLTTAIPQRSSVMDTAFAPYGQYYDSFNSGNNQCCSAFTGDFQDTLATLFDTPARELLQNAGRFRSCDSIHANWNCYAYATDPNTAIDRSGLVDTGVDSGPGLGCPEGESFCFIVITQDNTNSPVLTQLSLDNVPVDTPNAVQRYGSAMFFNHFDVNKVKNPGFARKQWRKWCNFINAGSFCVPITTAGGIAVVAGGRLTYDIWKYGRYPKGPYGDGTIDGTLKTVQSPPASEAAQEKVLQDAIKDAGGTPKTWTLDAQGHVVEVPGKAVEGGTEAAGEAADEAGGGVLGVILYFVDQTGYEPMGANGKANPNPPPPDLYQQYVNWLSVHGFDYF